MLFFDRLCLGSKKSARRATIDDLIQRKDNLLFLDFDGVINTEGRANKKCIRYLNRFCKKYNCRIVVSSSWRNYYDYKAFLYKSGLHKSIIIDGTTERLKSREDEIKKYVKDHPFLDKYVIIDDEELVGMGKHHIRTNSSIGFDKEKYKEAVELFEKMDEGK